MINRDKPRTHPKRSLQLWGKPLNVRVRNLEGSWVTLLNHGTGSALGDFAEVFKTGRYNPPLCFPVLTLAEDTEACRAAILKLAPSDEAHFNSKIAVSIEVRLSAVLDLCDPAIRRRLGVSFRDLCTGERGLTQAISVAARKAKLDGIVYPVGGRPLLRNLAIFLEQVKPTELIPTFLGSPLEGSGLFRTAV